MRADHRSARRSQPKGGFAQTVRRRRPALRAAAHGRGSSRSGDRRLFGAGARGRESRRRGGGLSRREPAAYAVPARPGTRKPLLSLGSPLPRSDFHRCARRRGPASRRAHERRARSHDARLCRRFRDQICRIRRCLARQARGARCLERSFRPRSRRAAGRSAHRRLPQICDVRRRGVAALCRLPGDRRGGSRRELAAMAARICATEKRRRSRPRSSKTGKPSSSPSSANGSPTASSGGPPRVRARGAWRSDSIAILRSAPRRTARNPGRMRRSSREASRSARRLIRFPSEGRTGACPRPIRFRRAQRLGLSHRDLSRQYAPRRHAAHRPRDGP